MCQSYARAGKYLKPLCSVSAVVGSAHSVDVRAMMMDAAAAAATSIASQSSEAIFLASGSVRVVRVHVYVSSPHISMHSCTDGECAVE